MPFDTSTKLYSLLAERITVPIYNKKRSDTISIKPILFLCVEISKVILYSLFTKGINIKVILF